MTNSPKSSAFARRPPDPDDAVSMSPRPTSRPHRRRIRKSAGRPTAAAGLSAAPERCGSLACRRAAAQLQRQLARTGRALGQADRVMGLCDADRGQLRSARHHETCASGPPASITARRLPRAELLVGQPSVDPAPRCHGRIFPRRPGWRCSSVERGHDRTASPEQIPRRDRLSIRPASASRAT